ncbi:MAG: RdgB/HAM1 family non-canonical purine NTP pyrophosphatase [Bacteroidota bacterium]
MKLLLATNNVNKRIEFQSLLPATISLLSLEDVAIHEELPEHEKTIEGNSLSKAKYASEKAGIPCMAEDTGLEVYAINNEPGVYSARYAGENATSADNIKLLLHKLHTISDRKARFKTVITYYENGQYEQFEGIIEGSIAEFEKGSNGFGYDSVFIPIGLDKTFAEMNLEQKNEYSHRKRAFVRFLSFYRNKL